MVHEAKLVIYGRTLLQDSATKLTPRSQVLSAVAVVTSAEAGLPASTSQAKAQTGSMLD